MCIRDRGTSPPSVARIRGRWTPTRRPPKVTDPRSLPWCTAVRSGSCLPRGPHAVATSASISELITCRPAPTARARRPSRMSSAISPIATVTSSGTASPGPALAFGVFLWYLLVTVVPFLVVSWRTPNTYPMGGVRRGTATQIPRDPGQPLEDAQIKLSVVVSDMFGVSGREMLAALIGGETNPQVLAQMARTRMRTKIPQLQEAFVGHFTDHHRFLLTKMLARIDALDVDIADLDTKIEAQIAPFADAVARLDEIPGVGATAAAVIIAEVGVDMTRFPTPAHLSVPFLRPADSLTPGANRAQDERWAGVGKRVMSTPTSATVSYTHLTLPTILRV